MAITLRTATGTFNTASAANPVGTEPAGAAQNDVEVALVVHENPANAITGPAGWTPLWVGASPTAGAGGFYYWAGYIVRGSGAPSLTWTSTGIVYYEVHILGLIGVDTNNPVEATSANGTTYTSTAKPDPPAAVATLTQDMSVTFGVQWGGSQGTAWGHPAYTIRTTNALGQDAIFATRLLTGSGSEDPAAFTDGTLLNSDGWNGGTVLFKDATESVGASVGARPRMGPGMTPWFTPWLSASFTIPPEIIPDIVMAP